MAKFVHWIMQRPGEGDSPGALNALCLAVVGFAGASIVYLRLGHRGGMWFLAYGLLWVGIVGLTRLYEASGAGEGRFLGTLVEGAFLVTYSLGGLELIDWGRMTPLLALGAILALAISCLAGGLLIIAILAERCLQRSDNEKPPTH